MTNIFLMRDGLGAEDRLTFSWAYVLNTVPRLGQRVTDLMSERAGLPKTQFVRAIDHPEGTQRDRPDFLLRTREWSMVMEHKLGAGLGVKQLERYLEYVGDGRRSYLALMSPQLMEVAPEVLRHRRYRRPAGRKHFLWQDFFPLLASSRTKLATDFAAYLGAIGVKPWQWGRLGDPFTDAGADEALRTVFGDVAGRLKAPGRTVIRSPVALGLEIRKPLPGIHLSYLHASPSIEAWDARVQGRALTLSVWVMRKTNRRVLARAYGYLRGSEPRIFVDDDDRLAAWRPHPHAERVYSASLPPILGRSPAGAADRIEAFVAACLGHLQGRGGIVAQERE